MLRFDLGAGGREFESRPYLAPELLEPDVQYPARAVIVRNATDYPIEEKK
jgi:hypothetical protein